MLTMSAIADDPAVRIGRHLRIEFRAGSGAGRLRDEMHDFPFRVLLRGWPREVSRAGCPHAARNNK